MTLSREELAIEALNSIISALGRLDEESRKRVLQAAVTFFEVQPARSAAPRLNTNENFPPARDEKAINLDYNADNAPTPKAFMNEKQPRTDVERVACLAYYLTHYRNTPYFKTLDLGKLNTEAAQPKFSNSTYASNNAIKMGYLVPATKGNRQLSAAGEQFVSALPDRELAKSVMENARPRRRGRRLVK